MTLAALPYFHDGAPAPPPVPTGSSEGTRRSGNTFSYTASAGATLYEVQVATDSGFTQIIIDGTTSGTTYTSPNTIDTLMANSTTYYWRVRASSGGAWSAWSAGRSFTTQNSRWVVTVPFGGVTFGTLDAVAVHQGSGDVFVLDITSQTIWVRRAATGLASALVTSVAASGGLAVYGDYVWWGAGTSIGYCSTAGGSAAFATTSFGTIHDLAFDYDQGSGTRVWLAQGVGLLNQHMPRLKLTTDLLAGPPFAFAFDHNSGSIQDSSPVVHAADGNLTDYFWTGAVLQDGANGGNTVTNVGGMYLFQYVNYSQIGHPTLIDAEGAMHLYAGIYDQTGPVSFGWGAGNWIADLLQTATGTPVSGQAGAAGYTDGEATAEALWHLPGDVWMAPWRDLYVCDTGNGVVRLLAFEIQTAPPRPLAPSSYHLQGSDTVTFSWEPVEWATHYHLQWAPRSIANFGFDIISTTVAAPTTSFTVLISTTSPDGNHWSWRVAAVDAGGTQYYWSDIVGFQVP